MEVAENIAFEKKEVKLTSVDVQGETFFRIDNHDKMDPFLMSIVSDGNHWMFVSSNGGLTAGRKDANYALFPYYTDDMLTSMADITGSKTIFQIESDSYNWIWEPFSYRQEGSYDCTRNLYKSQYGNKILFEEINHELGLTFRYQWNSSNQYGFVRKCELINHAERSFKIRVLDGLQNIMPHGVPADLQAIRSNLVDAYKRSELSPQNGIGIFALSSIIVDRAEPSEALKANVVWSLGFDSPRYLLSSTQLDAFRKGNCVSQEVDVKARKGAYFVCDTMLLHHGDQRQWKIIANVNQSVSSISALAKKIVGSRSLSKEIQEDIDAGTSNLVRLVASADGFQKTADDRYNTRHYSNTLFNIMRGGIFDNNYQIEKSDFIAYLQKANKEVFESVSNQLEGLAEEFSHAVLRRLAMGIDNPDFVRLAIEYLPLKFSRRHGDPSRPWNKFSINTTSEVDGSKILDYEGNWRDIFQNWEALAHSFPEFIDGMIFKFLNASTFDGYNPYRVTKDGFDWEVIEEHDPWSYIGYWGDHQIIYLLKFLEFVSDHYPDKLQGYLQQNIFVYANVPYRIKAYEELLLNPKDTIEFDRDLDAQIRTDRDLFGADGALIKNQKGEIHRVNLLEKLLATVLAKMSNFIPEAGIWLNTQRPEWNDANNALVGNGVSMVTLCYLRRFLTFMDQLLKSETGHVQVSGEVLEMFSNMNQTLSNYHQVLEGNVSDLHRKEILDGLGMSASAYRSSIYNNGFSGENSELDLEELKSFIGKSQAFLDHSIVANKRSDGMYHAYNLMTIAGSELKVSYLNEMLEGQVAVLSSGYLEPEESLALLDSLKQSALFREDQYSYLLYPNKELPGFLDRNVIPAISLQKSSLLVSLVEDGNNQIVEQDIEGAYHFNGNFNNAAVLKNSLKNLPAKYQDLVRKEQDLVLQIYEEVFNHKAFTGRSGTFYGYEGLGSIYWHMVSKLLLAVQECCLQAIQSKASDQVVGRLLEHYYEINEGIGAHKSPQLYGAFPTDPYSHTPWGKGAQQPGMTGQVKEDILSRFGELGVSVKNGQIHFEPKLLRVAEFMTKPAMFDYTTLDQKKKSVQVRQDMVAFTYCQVLVMYRIAEQDGIEVQYTDGSEVFENSLCLDKIRSRQIFSRTGEIDQIVVNLRKSHLR